MTYLYVKKALSHTYEYPMLMVLYCMPFSALFYVLFVHMHHISCFLTSVI